MLARREGAGNHAGIRLVVVDDHPHMRLLVRTLAEDVGYEVVGEASDGAKGVDEVAARQPDLVVMDWQMPAMDGVQATATIKRAQPDVQVIAFTSTSSAELQAQFEDAGACAVVAKDDVPGLVSALEHCRAAAR